VGIVAGTMTSGPQPLSSVAKRITGATTFGRMVLSAQERGGNVALLCPTPQGEQKLSYAELGESSRELARGLIAPASSRPCSS
jgi:hypothetical protein